MGRWLGGLPGAVRIASGRIQGTLTELRASFEAYAGLEPRGARGVLAGNASALELAPHPVTVLAPAVSP